MSRASLYCGDAAEVLRSLPEASVQCCITSPPYWGLRDYQMPGQVGLERTPEEYVERLVVLYFRELWRVLKDDGTLWLNMGDAYSAAPCGNHGNGTSTLTNGGAWQSERNAPSPGAGPRQGHRSSFRRDRRAREDLAHKSAPGTKPKDLLGLPWMLAFRLRSAGWWLRSDTIVRRRLVCPCGCGVEMEQAEQVAGEIVWSKPNAMPSSALDRPTRSHEYVFLLAKSERYFYDAPAIAEPLMSGPSDLKKMQELKPRIAGRIDDSPLNAANPKSKLGRLRGVGGQAKARKNSGNLKRDIPADEDGRGIRNNHLGRGIPWENDGAGRNARSVWQIPVQPYAGAHFATFPEELARRCILAGSRPGDTVLDLFGGTGTVAKVALGHGRSAIHIDLNPEYIRLAQDRVGGLLCDVQGVVL